LVDGRGGSEDGGMMCRVRVGSYYYGICAWEWEYYADAGTFGGWVPSFRVWLVGEDSHVDL